MKKGLATMCIIMLITYSLSRPLYRVHVHGRGRLVAQPISTLICDVFGYGFMIQVVDDNDLQIYNLIGSTTLLPDPYLCEDMNDGYNYYTL